MSEMVIQQLLRDGGAANVDAELVTVEPMGLEVAADWRTLQSPETYVGYGQSSGFAQEGVAAFDQPREYAALPLRLNEWALAGGWTVARHAGISNQAGGRIAFRFHARDVNLVMAPARSRRHDPVPRPARRAAAGGCERCRRGPDGGGSAGRAAHVSAHPPARASSRITVSRSSSSKRGRRRTALPSA